MEGNGRGEREEGRGQDQKRGEGNGGEGKLVGVREVWDDRMGCFAYLLRVHHWFLSVMCT